MMKTLGGVIAAAGLALAVAGCESGTSGQAGGTPVPYKLGTFERSGQTFVGLVLKDTQVVDIAQANSAYEGSNASAPKLTVSSDLKQIIATYDSQWRDRLGSIAKDVSTAKSAPPYAYAVDTLKVLPPVRPALILNAGANYVEHEQGIAAQAQRQGGAPAAAPAPSKAVTAPGIWERKADDTRDNPYLFLKSPTVVVGPSDPIVVPRGRVNIDYECEFNVVIGKPAKYVSVANAADYIFGYTVQIDVSDRGGRGDQKMGGPDWLVGKNHDTFAPIGPFIVPKAFLPAPMNTRHTFTLNDTVMQDSNTSRMSHNIYELVSFGSHILTLGVGDLIAGGSPAGTNIERAEPRWMRAGDTAKCAIEGVGTQVHPIVAEPAPQTN